MLEKFSGSLKQIKQSPDKFRQSGDLSGVGAQRCSDSGGSGGSGEVKPATALAQAH